MCRILQRAPYSKLILGFWFMSLYGFYAIMASGDTNALLFLAPAMGCGSLLLLAVMLHKERAARCYELTPTDSCERRQGLSRPLIRLGRNYCWALALAIQPLWLLVPHQAPLLIHLTCQLALVGPLTGPLLAPVVFDAGTSKSPAGGFWLSILMIYLLGFIPGLVGEGLLSVLAPL